MPAITTGDGNCLFRSLSVALFGTENHHKYLRLITAIEMTLYMPYYDRTSTRFFSPFQSVEEVPSIKSLLRQVTTDGASCGIMHLLGVSAATRRPLMSFCPPGAAFCSPLTSHPYTMRIAGRGVDDDGADDPLPTVMWTATEVPSSIRELTPNHFVSLLPRSRLQTEGSVREDGSVYEARSVCGSVDVESSSVHVTSDEEYDHCRRKASCSSTDATMEFASQRDRPAVNSSNATGDSPEIPTAAGNFRNGMKTSSRTSQML
jgi:hypothetical protein